MYKIGVVGVFCSSSGSAELEWEVICLLEKVSEVRRLLWRTMMDGRMSRSLRFGSVMGILNDNGRLLGFGFV